MFGVGKYETRNGLDVEIVAVVNGVAIGFMNGDPVDADSWDAETGVWYLRDSCESEFDLIDPNAKKPIKLELWLTIYHDSSLGYFIGGQYLSLDQAKQNKCSDCIAITKVETDCTEGDNLD